MRSFPGPRNTTLGAIMLSGVLCLCIGLDKAPAQPTMPMPDQGAAQASLDSLRRVITKRILSDAQKKDIRSCDREKTQFLKQCRAAEPATSDVDRRLNEAKLKSADQNDTAIQSLMEKKFILEKACDDKYSATARGQQCVTGEQKRQVALEKALAKDKEYQALRVRAEAVGVQHL